MNFIVGSKLEGHSALLLRDISEINQFGFHADLVNYFANQVERSVSGWMSAQNGTNTLFVNILAKGEYPLESARKAGASLWSLVHALRIDSVSLFGGEHTIALAEGLGLANYKFNELFSVKKEAHQVYLQTATLLGVSENECQEVQNIVDATCATRDLINRPWSHLNATQLAESAKAFGDQYGFNVEILNKKKIESLKMGGLLGVNAGSVDEPTFSILEYKPSNAKNAQPIVLVGKGVVYDTGGLSLKPTAGMDTMKSDMGGAAAVIGTFIAAAANKLPIHLVGLIPATDNRPGGNAVTPGDVITISDGTTVEVLNTDAEGRLILADALHYAKKYRPELVIDLATLTGAAARAIGIHGIVAMGTAGEEVWSSLHESGEKTYERIVRFPFWSEYDDMLKSDIADLKNIGGVEGGAITAGKFLAHFTDYPYVHLDIAGPAYLDAPDGYRKKGATGVGVRLLYDYLKNLA